MNIDLLNWPTCIFNGFTGLKKGEGFVLFCLNESFNYDTLKLFNGLFILHL